jgi:thiosulfate/3-mercaptopyruvate sulfurtransferase
MAYSTLISAETLRALEPQPVLLDARRAPTLPTLAGAVHAHLEHDLSATPTDLTVQGRHPLPSLQDWCATLGSWGIGQDTQVVVFDDKGGALAAARAWWMLKAVGHRAVAVLDGGLATAEGLPRAEAWAKPAPVAAYPAPAWKRPTVGFAEVESGHYRVLDVRDAPRYDGETEPVDPVAGHIPGAHNAPFRESLHDGRFLPPDALATHLDRVLDGRDPSETILSCGSGVTACHTLLALEHAGRPGAALFVGSWSAWCRSGRGLA